MPASSQLKASHFITVQLITSSKKARMNSWRERREEKQKDAEIRFKRGKQTRMKEEKMTADSQSSIKSSTCCFNVIHSKEMLQLHDRRYLLINSRFLFEHLHLPHSLHLHL